MGKLAGVSSMGKNCCGMARKITPGSIEIQGLLSWKCANQMNDADVPLPTNVGRTSPVKKRSPGRSESSERVEESVLWLRDVATGLVQEHECVNHLTQKSVKTRMGLAPSAVIGGGSCFKAHNRGYVRICTCSAFSPSPEITSPMLCVRPKS
jgi:hypothetical protein